MTFKQEQAHFARIYPHIAKSRLVILDGDCAPYSHCAKRDYAVADVDTNTIYITRRALSLPLNNIIGLIRHELGHLAEPENASEQHADDIAEAVTGQRVKYDRNLVQTIGRGSYPRPRHLPR